MEWADSLREEQVIWLCLEEETVEQPAKLIKQLLPSTERHVLRNSWLEMCSL